VVGRVRGVHGIRGRVRVELLTDRPEERFRVGSVLRREDDATPLTIVEARPVADGPGWWLRFAEIGDRNAADALREAYLVGDVPTDELAHGEVYWHELIGVPVVDRGGRALGSVVDVYRAGAAEVVTIAGGPLGSIDVPLVEAMVPEFRPREGRIVIDVEALDLPATPLASRPRGRRTRRALAGRAAGSPQDPSAGSDDGSPGGGDGVGQR
jgi:16S rRNA processing protein RimM